MKSYCCPLMNKQLQIGAITKHAYLLNGTQEKKHGKVFSLLTQVKKIPLKKWKFDQTAISHSTLKRDWKQALDLIRHFIDVKKPKKIILAEKSIKTWSKFAQNYSIFFKKHNIIKINQIERQPRAL